MLLCLKRKKQLYLNKIYLKNVIKSFRSIYKSDINNQFLNLFDTQKRGNGEKNYRRKKDFVLCM